MSFRDTSLYGDIICMVTKTCINSCCIFSSSFFIISQDKDILEFREVKIKVTEVKVQAPTTVNNPRCDQVQEITKKIEIDDVVLTSTMMPRDFFKEIDENIKPQNLMEWTAGWDLDHFQNPDHFL